jgi:hypothetical protein
VLSFVGAIAFVVYYSPGGTYVALGLVLVGSFMMVISAMLRERSHAIRGAPARESPAVEDEETAFSS